MIVEMICTGVAVSPPGAAMARTEITMHIADAANETRFRCGAYDTAAELTISLMDPLASSRYEIGGRYKLSLEPVTGGPP